MSECVEGGKRKIKSGLLKLALRPPVHLATRAGISWCVYIGRGLDEHRL